MLKKYGLYAVLVLGGILMGFLFFGSSSNTISHDEKNHTKVEGRWTCSMHPHISGEENGTCPLCAMDLVYIEETDAASLSMNQLKLSRDALALADVQTSVVGSIGNVEAFLRMSGMITSNAETDAVQTTLYEGRIDELWPNSIGKKVWKGQEIGKIYSPELYLAQDKLLTSVSYRETHPKLYDAARYTLGLWKMTDEQIDQMIAAGKPMMNFPILSDVTGTVTEVLAKEGNFYKEGTPIFKVSNLNSVWAVFDAHEDQLPFLDVGQEIEINLTAVPGEKIIGKIAFIDPILDSKKRVASVRVVLKNRAGKLKPGMFAGAKVATNIDSNQEKIAIPKSAVLWTGKRSIVYTKPYADRPVFELTEVVLGQPFNDEYIVLSGLRMGDEIVTHGAFTVDAAAQLNGKNSMMNKPHPLKEEGELDLKSIKDSNAPQPLSISSLDKIDAFLGNYFELKDALVATDFEEAKKSMASLKGDVSEIIKNSSTPENWSKVDQYLKSMISARNIDGARKQFKPFSDYVIQLVKAMEGHQETLYVQFCPMADNNKGAFWLSLQEEIRNPYFGEKMLICGMVKEQIN